MAMQIRDAVLSDFEEIKEIYNQIVLTSTATYNDRPATLEEKLAWRRSRLAQRFPCWWRPLRPLAMTRSSPASGRFLVSHRLGSFAHGQAIASL